MLGITEENQMILYDKNDEDDDVIQDLLVPDEQQV